MSSVKPGWYPDPAAPETQRYWDGEQWVGAAIPADVTPPATPPAAPPPVPPPAPTDLPGQPGEPAVPPGDATTPFPPTPQYPRVPTRFPPPSGRDRDAGRSPVAAPPEPFRPSLRETERAPLPAAIPLAPLGSRLVARIIDLAAVLVLNVLINGWFFMQYYSEVAPTIQAYARAIMQGDRPPALDLSDKAVNLNLVISVIALALWFAYEVPATANSGQTLGKRLVRIRVVRLDARGLTFGQSLRRWFVLGLPSLVLGTCGLPFQLLDVLWCTWDRPAQQCLHDKLAQTIVVRAVAAGAVDDAHGAEPGDDARSD